MSPLICFFVFFKSSKMTHKSTNPTSFTVHWMGSKIYNYYHLVIIHWTHGFKFPHSDKREREDGEMTHTHFW